MPGHKKSKRGTGQGSKEQPLTWRKRREVFSNARHLDREIPRLLHKVRARVPTQSLWTVADAARELRAYRKHPRAEQNVLEMAALVEKVDGLADKHLSQWRKSPRREYAESIVVALLIALFIRTFLFEPYKIPSGSMIPTLMVGDHIFVSKFIYGVRVPYTRIRLGGWRVPERGDVIVFEFPGPGEHHGVDYIKRVMAIPGDRVWMKDNDWHIRPSNGDPAYVAARSILNNAHTCLASTEEPLSPEPGDRCECTFIEEASQSHEWVVQHINQCCRKRPGTRQNTERGGNRVLEDCRAMNTANWPSETPKDNHSFPQTQLQKDRWAKLCKGKTTPAPNVPDARWWFMCGWGPGGWDGDWSWEERVQFVHEKDNQYELEIPEDFVMVLGDNRDNSEDGRRWGLVPHDRIKGKALFIWAAGNSFWHPDWKRLFRRVH